MEYKEIENLICNNLESMKNMYNDIKIKIYRRREQKNLLKYEYICIDYRILDEKYIDNSVSFGVFNERTDECLGVASFLILSEEEYKNIFCWKYNKEEDKLDKVSINDCLNLNKKFCIILGFAMIDKSVFQNNNIFYSSKIIKIYINAIDKILKDKDIFCYLEATGTYILDDNILNKKELRFDNYITKEKLGQICYESKSIKVLAKILKLERIENLYHSITLGPIYCKK